MLNEKRGLSPIIATMLLISIALVLAALIFFWAKSFIGENVQKNLGEGAEPIERACEKVDFKADAQLSGGMLTINLVNEGNVPIYQLDVKLKGAGSLKSLGFANFRGYSSALSGKTTEASLKTNSSVNNGNTLVIVPVIIGESGDENPSYVCESQGQEVTVEP